MFKKLTFKKFLVFYLVLIAVIQIGWFMFVLPDFYRKYERTTATVIQISTFFDTRGAARTHKPGGTMIYPVYSFTDKSGTTHTYEDKNTSAKQGSFITRHIFVPDVGDKKTAYYLKTDPSREAFVVAGFFAYIPWVAPIYFGMIILFIILFFWGLRWLTKVKYRLKSGI